MITNKEQLFKKLRLMSDKYHRLSFLFLELEQSLRKKERQGATFKELKAELSKIDMNKVKDLTKLGFKDILKWN